jgi:hypothetical protein
MGGIVRVCLFYLRMRIGRVDEETRGRNVMLGSKSGVALDVAPVRSDSGRLAEARGRV